MNVERSNPVRFGGAVEGRLAPVGSRDAFGRWRPSDPYQLFASALYHDALPLLWDDQQVSGAGTTSTYNANQSTVTTGEVP